MGGMFSPVPGSVVSGTAPSIFSSGAIDSSKSMLPSELSMTELLAFAEVFMKNNSEQIRAQYAGMQSAQEDSKSLSKVLDFLNGVHANSDDSKCCLSFSDATYGKFVTTPSLVYSDPAFKALSGDSKNQLYSLFKEMASRPDTTSSYWACTKTAVEDLQKSVSNDQQALNSGNEMQMLKLQSMVSAGSTIFQSLSNVMSVLNETLKAPVNNLKG